MGSCSTSSTDLANIVKFSPSELFSLLIRCFKPSTSEFQFARAKVGSSFCSSAGFLGLLVDLVASFL